MTCATPPEDASSDPANGQTGPEAEGSKAMGETDSAQEVAASSTKLFRTDPDLAPGLYVVSTPIGNLRDISLRALDILASVDMVCAEDTRVTAKLLNAFGVSARLRP